MIFCGNNPYIESITEPVSSRITKRSSLCYFDWEENPEKGIRLWKKSIHELKAQFVYLSVCF